MEHDVEFHDQPPPSRGGRPAVGGYVQAFVEACRANPGRWAIYDPDGTGWASSTSGQYLKRRYGLQAVTRRSSEAPKSKAEVWARWPGDGTDDD